jgi:hypothetical protein
MIRSRHSRRAIMVLVLALLVCAAGASAFAETWEPASTGFATDIAISTSGGNPSAAVKFTCSTAGYRVTDWGSATRNDTEFSVDAKLERWNGPAAQMIITLAHTYSLGALAPGTYSFVVKVYGSVVKRVQFTVGGTTAVPRLLTEENTDRAVALESVTLLRGPFSYAGRSQLNSDAPTRVMLFASDVELGQAVTAQAEDAQHKTYPLTVEYIGKAPNHDWLTQVIVKLPADVGGAGDLWISINVGSFVSNKVVISVSPTN